MRRKPKLRLVGQKKPDRLQTIDKQYFAVLHALVDSVFELACDKFDWSWEQFAEQAQLSPSTVYKLGNRVTQYPRYFTVFKLARAVGMDLKLAELPRRRSTASLKLAAM
jgi:hypothetical protein